MNTEMKQSVMYSDKVINRYPTLGRDGTQRGWVKVVELQPTSRRISPTKVINDFEKKTALISDTLENLEMRVALWNAAGTIPGQVIITEKLESELTPDFWEKTENPDSKVKYAGDTGVPCTLGGERIFRFVDYTLDMSEFDTLIAHDNGDSIKAVQAAAKTAEVTEPAAAGLEN